MKFFSWVRLVIFILFFGQSALALIVKLSDLHTMAKHSDVIIHGYVGEQRVTTDELGRLITLTDIEVIEGLYGAKTCEIITVYQVGGHKDGRVMPIIGGQIYHIGQEVILFGLKLGNTFVSFGAGQGKLDVVNEEGNETVVEDLGNVSAIALEHDTKNYQVFRPSPLSFPEASLVKDEIRLMLTTR